jgi:hypothetical protein
VKESQLIRTGNTVDTLCVSASPALLHWNHANIRGTVGVRKKSTQIARRKWQQRIYVQFQGNRRDHTQESNSTAEETLPTMHGAAQDDLEKLSDMKG